MRLRCDALGEELEWHERRLEFCDEAPTKATVYSPSWLEEVVPGKPISHIEFSAVCPVGHDLGVIGQAPPGHVRCDVCGKHYGTDFEID